MPRTRKPLLPLPPGEPDPVLPPPEVTVFVEEDGTITFSDLPADLAEVALLLDPEAAIACPVPRGRRKKSCRSE